MNDPITDSSIDSAQIYDGGNFNIITAEELKGNLVAIKQLINNFNEKNQKLRMQQEKIRLDILC